MAADYPQVHPRTRKAWRSWLEKNHTSAAGVWLVYHKKTAGFSRVDYADAVEEALCFGWIDSLPRTLDETRSMLKFTPRKPKSVWSKLNKSRVERLITTGLMTAAGMAAIQIAKENGSWDSLTASNNYADNNTMPADLEKALRRSAKALRHFNAFSRSIRLQFITWIEAAKRPETRTQRILQTTRMSLANVKPGLKGFVIPASLAGPASSSKSRK